MDRSLELLTCKLKCRIALLNNLILLVVMCSMLATTTRAFARTWTGDGPSVGGVQYWSNPVNWNPQGVPQNGEDLFFSDTLSDDVFMFNDLTNLTVRRLDFAFEDIGDVSAHLSGNAIGVSLGIFNNHYFECQVYIHCGVKLTGDATFITGNTDYTAIFATEVTQMHLIGPVDLNGHNLVLHADSGINSEGRLYVEGGITGVGNVLATAGGYNTVTHFAGGLEFKGTGNSFSGALTLNSLLGSEILLNIPAGVVANTLVVVTNVGDVKLSRPEQIGDAATLRIQDGSTFKLNGYNETIQHLEMINDSNDARPSTLDTGTGTLLVQGNITSTCNSASETPTIKGKLNMLAGAHVVNVGGSSALGLEMQAEMMGFGNFSKSGTSALILQSSNSFNSTISILQGVVDVRHNHGLGDIAGSTELFGGALTLRNVNIGAELLSAIGQGTGGELPGSVLTSIGISSWAGQVTLLTNLVVNGDMTFSGPISGSGGLGCFGGGTVRLAGTLANTYTGMTLARCPLLELNKAFDVNAFSGPLVVGGTIGGPSEVRWLNSFQCASPVVTVYPNGSINLNGFNDDFGPIHFNSGIIATGTGLLGINGLVSVYPNVSPALMNGRIFLPAGSREFYVYFGDGGLTINAAVSGPGHLRKTGGGGMRLSASNSYSGLTLVDEGILTVTHPSALGTSDPGTIVANGATLSLLSVNGIVPELISARGSGAASGYGALSVIGNVTLRTPFPSIYPCLDLTTNAVITVDPGSQLIADGFISGIGPLIKNGSGTLVFNNANPNTYTGDTIVNAGTLELRKPFNVRAIPANLVIGPAAASSPATVRFFQTGALAVNSNVTVNANSLLDLNGNNQTLALLNLNDGGDVQTGAGQIAFSASAIVNVGTLNPFPPGLFASSSISGNLGLPVSDYLTFNVGGYGPAPLVPDSELVVSAAISGAGNIIKAGPGGMLLSGNNSFNATPQILAGDIFVNGGTLIAGSAAALGGVGGWTYVNNDASIALINGITINNETLNLNTTRVPALDNRGGDNLWTGPINLSRDSSIGVNQDWSLHILGVIGGTGSVTKTGAGTLRIGGVANNNHTGNTLVNEGTLLLSKSPFVQAVPHDLIIGSGQANAPATLVKYLNDDPVWNNIIVNRAGLLDLNGFLENAGDLTLNGGGDVQTGAGTLSIVNLAVNPGSFGDQSVISGQLGLYAGAHLFTVAAGTPAHGNADCLMTAAVLQSGNSTASLEKIGTGALRLTGTNNYKGATKISGGTLWVDGVQAQSAVQLGERTSLKGVGTVGHITVTGDRTVFTPGASAGILTCSNFNISGGSGTLEIELNSFPTGYDQINARGSVNLNGLTLKASLNFASASDNEFVLINNDGVDVVVGTFSGLPQNKRLYVGSELFRINYAGGSGNDVVLSRLTTPPPPVLTLQRIPPSAVRLLWPTNDPPFRLEFKTNLNLTAWSSTTPPSATGTNHVLTNAVVADERFYRLASP